MILSAAALATDSFPFCDGRASSACRRHDTTARLCHRSACCIVVCAPRYKTCLVLEEASATSRHACVLPTPSDPHPKPQTRKQPRGLGRRAGIEYRHSPRHLAPSDVALHRTPSSAQRCIHTFRRHTPCLDRCRRCSRSQPWNRPTKPRRRDPGDRHPSHSHWYTPTHSRRVASEAQPWSGPRLSPATTASSMALRLARRCRVARADASSIPQACRSTSRSASSQRRTRRSEAPSTPPSSVGWEAPSR